MTQKTTTQILPVALYGRLKVFEIKVLMRKLGHKKEEVTGEQGLLYSEWWYNLHSSLDAFRVSN
jgi:hypothetical protein